MPEGRGRAAGSVVGATIGQMGPELAEFGVVPAVLSIYDPQTSPAM